MKMGFQNSIKRERNLYEIYEEKIGACYLLKVKIMADLLDG